MSKILTEKEALKFIGRYIKSNHEDIGEALRDGVENLSWTVADDNLAVIIAAANKLAEEDE